MNQKRVVSMAVAVLATLVSAGVLVAATSGALDPPSAPGDGASQMYTLERDLQPAGQRCGGEQDDVVHRAGGGAGRYHEHAG